MKFETNKQTLFSFKNALMAGILLAMGVQSVSAEERTIDISGDNTSSDYKSYSTSVAIPAGDIVNVKMARYCYFSSTVTGSGLLNLYGGGERCYLGTKSGSQWANMTNFKGDIHIHPFVENSPKAGFWGVILAHGGKSFSPENINDAINSGKVNKTMENNHVTLHAGTTILAGTIIPSKDYENTLLGIIKEGTGSVYSLDGRRVNASNLQLGLYVKNGKKVVVK